LDLPLSQRKLGGGVAPISRVFADEWQGKDLRDTECARVASKGLAEGRFCALTHERTRAGRQKVASGEG